MPTLVFSNFDYAALLHPSDSDNPSDLEFKKGTLDDKNNTITFAFKMPDIQTGLTLEIFAFKKDTDETTFTRESACLYGKNDNIEIKDNKITALVSLSSNTLPSAPKGTVNLKIKVPVGYDLSISEIKEDGTTATDDEMHFKFTDNSSDDSANDLLTYTVVHKGEGLSAKAYQLNFTVKKDGFLVYAWSEAINVFSGVETDTWSNLEQGGAREITQSQIYSSVYVRGSGGWYAGSDFNATATASDDNMGSLMSPFATIQRAIDAIIARNDGTSAYTILVDGTIDGKTTPLLGANGMADFSALDKNLNLTIKALDATGKATLDGGAKIGDDGTVTDEGIGKRVINVTPKHTDDGLDGALNLTLENLEITGGNHTSGGGGGIYIHNPKGMLLLKDCTIHDNDAKQGGGIYINASKLEIVNTEISENTAKTSGGGIYINKSTVNLGGSALVKDENDIYSNGGTIKVASTLTQTKVATITLPDANYTAGKKVLDGDADLLSANYTKFTLSNDAWKIGSDGCLINATTLEGAIDKIKNAGSGETVDVSVSVSASDNLSELTNALKNTNAKSVSLSLTNNTSTEVSLGWDFNGLEKLESLELHGKINPAEYVFQNSTNLKRIALSIPTVVKGLFLGCGNLQTVALEDGVKSIGEQAFKDCTSLAGTTIPTSVTLIGKEAFNGCTSLSSVEFVNKLGWTVNNETSTPSSEPVDVSIPSENATYLKETYCLDKWTRS